MLDAFAVVSEPNRRRILDLLRERERSVGELVSELDLSQPTVSKHLKVLKEARLVAAEASANLRFYRLCPEPLAELDAWLSPYRVLWSRRLDALGAYLDASAPDVPAKPATRRRQRPRKKA